MNGNPTSDGIWRNVRLQGSKTESCIVVNQGHIEWVGPQHEIPAAQFSDLKTYDANGAWATPGLVDCHTHLVYAGNRANEFAMRLEGVTASGNVVVSNVFIAPSGVTVDTFDK